VPKLIPLLGLLTLTLALASPASARIIVGTPGDDSIEGTDRRDHVFARAGNDTVLGKGGSDFLHGQRGDDSLSGENGPDFLFGGPGNDTLEGGANGDHIYTGWGLDTVDAGAGNDRVHSGPDDGVSDVIDCGEGWDRAFIRTGDIAENCERVRAVRPHRPGARGEIHRGTRGDDVIVGGEGRDFILGRAGNDTLTGLGGSDFIFGMSGNDTLNGDAGVDRLWGGRGNDNVNGGDDADWLFAGWGTDTLNGGGGNDRLWAAANDSLVDNLDCGDGNHDRATIRPGDVAVNCELVKTLTS
jgi:Ca2+-binding RTX toxin-like protein